MPPKRSKSYEKRSTTPAARRSKTPSQHTSKSDPSTSNETGDKPRTHHSHRERARSASKKGKGNVKFQSPAAGSAPSSKKSSAASSPSTSRKNHRYYEMSGEPEPLPWFNSAHPELAQSDKHCLQFIGELWAFLQAASERGVVRGQLHPDMGKFLDEYAPSLRYTVKLCADKLTANEQIWNTMKNNDTLVFPDGLAEMLNLCLQRLVIRLKGMKRPRTHVETTYDEVFAAPLLAILELITTPQHAERNIKLSRLVITRCYTWMVAYLKALPHVRCKGHECHCMANAGPIETALETAVLPGGKLFTIYFRLFTKPAAKFCADLTFLKPIFYAELKSIYTPLISFNWVLALSILLMKGKEREVETYLPKIVNDLSILSHSGADCVNSVMVIRTEVGEYTAQGQCSDFVLVALDLIVKKLAVTSPRLFTVGMIDAIESFYVNERPMSAMIVFEILCIFAENRPDLVEGRRNRYLKAADDMQLGETYLKRLRKFPM